MSDKIGKTPYFVLNRVDDERKAATLEFLDRKMVAASIPETKKIFMTGLSGEELDFPMTEIGGLADRLNG